VCVKPREFKNAKKTAIPLPDIMRDGYRVSMNVLLYDLRGGCIQQTGKHFSLLGKVEVGQQSGETFQSFASIKGRFDLGARQEMAHDRG